MAAPHHRCGPSSYFEHKVSHSISNVVSLTKIWYHETSLGKVAKWTESLTSATPRLDNAVLKAHWYRTRWPFQIHSWTHWSRDNIAAILRMAFSNAFFFCENVWISLRISMKLLPNVRINNIPAFVQIMAWCTPGDKPLSEPMMFSLLTHICVTQPQWVNIYVLRYWCYAPGNKNCDIILIILILLYKECSFVMIKSSKRKQWMQYLLIVSYHSTQKWDKIYTNQAACTCVHAHRLTLRPEQTADIVQKFVVKGILSKLLFYGSY